MNSLGNHEKYMQQALACARRGVQAGQTPFGACVVKAGKVVSVAHNRVWKDKDITAHAEIVAIRQACAKLRTIDLSGCIMYSTCEPCPMCFSACHWARISMIVFGARIRDARKAGFHELPISNREMGSRGQSRVKVIAGCLREDILALFQGWGQRPDRRVY